MNPTAFHPHRRPTRAPLLPYGTCVCDDCEFPQPRPASQSFLEPGGEGIVFAVMCVVCSSLVYGAVLLFRFLA